VRRQNAVEIVPKGRQLLGRERAGAIYQAHVAAVFSKCQRGAYANHLLWRTVRASRPALRSVRPKELEHSMTKTQRTLKGSLLLALIALASACVAEEPRDGFYDQQHQRYYHAHEWHDCGERDNYCR
jgi:hypothetical protein